MNSGSAVGFAGPHRAGAGFAIRIHVVCMDVHKVRIQRLNRGGVPPTAELDVLIKKNMEAGVPQFTAGSSTGHGARTVPVMVVATVSCTIGTHTNLYAARIHERRIVMDVRPSKLAVPIRWLHLCDLTNPQRCGSMYYAIGRGQSLVSAGASR